MNNFMLEKEGRQALRGLRHAGAGLGHLMVKAALDAAFVDKEASAKADAWAEAQVARIRAEERRDAAFAALAALAVVRAVEAARLAALAVKAVADKVYALAGAAVHTAVRGRRLPRAVFEAALDHARLDVVLGLALVAASKEVR